MLKSNLLSLGLVTEMGGYFVFLAKQNVLLQQKEFTDDEVKEIQKFLRHMLIGVWLPFV